jgi:hypothetical protein
MERNPFSPRSYYNMERSFGARSRHMQQRLLSIMLVCVACLACAATLAAGESLPRAGVDPGGPMPGLSAPARIYMPVITNSGACAPIAGSSYQGLSVASAPTDRPAEAHADLNLALRGYTPANGELGLVAYNGGSDPAAPQLPGLFSDRRTPVFRSVQRVYDWNWVRNCRADAIVWPPVTLARLATTPGEIIALPGSGYSIGDGFMALVLYAGPERLTLKYTREDNVVHGYTLHLDGLCVEPALLALYQSLNAAGRGMLPALRGGQAVGRASDTAIGVAIRDAGSFMDPRSRKDWWQGR